MANSKIPDLTEKSTPVDGDDFVVEDNTATETKKVGFDNLKATLKTYFDTVYGTSVVDEAMGGSGVNRTIANTPISGTLKVYDGIARLHKTTDFSQTGTAVTFVVAPDSPTADYRH